MDVEKKSIVCLACEPGYTPEYFVVGELAIKNCVEIQHCKKASLWVNGCDEPNKNAFYELVDGTIVLTNVYYHESIDENCQVVLDDDPYICVKCKAGYELVIKSDDRDIWRCFKSTDSTCKDNQGGDFYDDDVVPNNLFALVPAKWPGCIECKSKTDVFVFSPDDFLCLPLDGIEDDFANDVKFEDYITNCEEHRVDYSIFLIYCDTCAEGYAKAVDQ